MSGRWLPGVPRRLVRIGHAELGVTDLARSRDFYTRCANLVVVDEEADAVYLRAQYEHHSLVLRRAERAEVLHLGYETDDDAATAALREQLASQGVPVEDSEPEPGRLGEAFRFRDPEGFCVEVYRAMAHRAGLISAGPHPVLRLGHFTLVCRDVAAQTDFYRNAVGFRVSDFSARRAFLRCNRDHHALAFLQGGASFLHHLAFDVGGWPGIVQALDWFARQQWAVEAGPVRHAEGNNIAVYVSDPDGFRVEFYAEMESIDDDEDHVRPDYLPFFNLWRRAESPPGFHERLPRDEHGKPRQAPAGGA